MNPENLSATVSSRRHTEQPTLWISVLSGSMLLHIFLLLAFRYYWLHSAKVEIQPAPIAVEFVTSKTSRSGIAAPGQVIAPGKTSKSTPLGSSRSSSTTRLPRNTASVPDTTPSSQTPQKPASFPNPEDPPVQQTKPPKPQKRNPTQPETKSTSSQQPKGTNPKTGNQTSQTEDAGSSTPPGNPGKKSDTGSGNEGPAETGQPLPPINGTAQVSLTNFQQVQDRKAQSAKPKQSAKQISITLPGKFGQNSRFAIKAHLAIDVSGNVVEVIDAELTGLDSDTARSIARQIFNTWEFEAAQDGLPGAPLKSVFSDLWVEAQIQLL
jgi:outer membrane biosynthesis protein TonB